MNGIKFIITDSNEIAPFNNIPSMDLKYVMSFDTLTAKKRKH